ncbi:MAG: hypothetical protein J0M16_04945 [Gammaproteobacteria bacterium]|nr:hypothetical protein [Gammaproteobacteria bacterium]
MILLNELSDAGQAEKAQALRRAAFSNSEIADLLGTTAAVVAQQLYTKRSRASKKKTARRKS